MLYEVSVTFNNIVLGYGKGYQYNLTHKGPVDQTYLPEKLEGVDLFADTWS